MLNTEGEEGEQKYLQPKMGNYLWKIRDPREKAIPVFTFNPMRQKSYVMNKVVSPGSERRPLIPENLAIPQNPNIPSSCKNHFSEENMAKILPSLYSHVISGHPRMRIPMYLQIIPNSHTEVT